MGLAPPQIIGVVPWKSYPVPPSRPTGKPGRLSQTKFGFDASRLTTSIDFEKLFPVATNNLVNSEKNEGFPLYAEF